MNDKSTGLWFNFPGYSRLRPIPWDEWFEHFDRHDLLFVYEQEDQDQVARQAYARWKNRGEEDGHDRKDWLAAETDLQRNAGGGAPSVRYRIFKSRPG